ncbi:hypothetical protein GCM10028777_13090 [Angustibacter speluncae]
MEVIHGALELAIAPEIWTVELRDGRSIEVLTHGYSIEGDDCVFSLLFRGEPNFEVTSLRLPLALLPADFHEVDPPAAT